MKKIIPILILVFAFATTSYSQCSNPDAGEDFSVCGNYATITVTNATTGYWSALRDGNPYPLTGLSDTTSTVFEFYFPAFTEPTVSFDFVWNDDSAPGCIAIVNVVFANPPIASVGPIEMAELCGNVTTLSADTTGDVYSQEMYWTAPDMLCLFDDVSIPNASAEIDPVQFGDSAYFQAEFIWNMVNYACHSTDTMYVTFYQRPETYAGLDNAFCGKTGELGAVLDFPETENYEQDCHWSVISTPFPSAAVNISQVNEDSTFVTASHNGVYDFVIRENNSLLPMCYDKDTVQIEFVEVPVIYAGDDQEVCGTCFYSEAISAGFQGYWEPGSMCWVDFPDENLTHFCCPSYGDHEFIWIEENESTISDLVCISTDTVIVTTYRIPTANIITNMLDTLNCGLSTQLLDAEEPGYGLTGYWYSDNPLVYFQSDFDTNPTVTVPDFGFYDFYWIEFNGPGSNPAMCRDTAGPVSMYFLNDEALDAGQNDEVEGLQYTLTASSEILENAYENCVYIWENEDAFFEERDNLTTLVSVPSYGEYVFELNMYYVLKPECKSLDSVKINFVEPLDGDISEINNEKKVLVYPNPVKEILTIHSESKIDNYKILDINGRVVKRGDCSELQLDVSDIETGIYFIELRIKDSIITKKFVKQ